MSTAKYALYQEICLQDNLLAFGKWQHGCEAFRHYFLPLSIPLPLLLPPISAFISCSCKKSKLDYVSLLI